MFRFAAALAVLVVSAEARSPYEHALAKRLVNYAGASYCVGQKSVADWTCPACQSVSGFKNITSHIGAGTDASAIVGYDPTLGARVVAFMGTNANLETWIDDVNILPSACYQDVGCNGCNCHPGFKKAYDSIGDSIHHAVVNLPPGKLIITGHSLGGAQAMQCAIDFHHNRDIQVDQIYTFGQPRIGNDAFVTHYDNIGFDHWRITHHRDPIPHLPWRGLGGYKQNLQEAYYEDSDANAPQRICDPHFAEDPLCADQFNDELSVLHITDHWSYLGFSFAKDVLKCTFGGTDEALIV